MLKYFFYGLLILQLASCCLGNRKYIQENLTARFRITAKLNGNDLLFGPTKVYDYQTLRFYSLNGTDTIIHNSEAGAYPNPGQDSLIYVSFDYRKTEQVFVRLSPSDVDTLILQYIMHNASPCCEDYSIVKPYSYNQQVLMQAGNGTTVIKK